MPQYGEVRVDFITYTTGVSPSEGNVTVPVSGLINNPTFSGNLIVEGDAIFEQNVSISGNLTVTGTTDLSGIVTTSGDLNVGGDLAVTGNISGNADGGVYGSGYWKIPDGTTGERPGTPVSGMIRYNTTLERYEGYGEEGWNLLGGGATGSGTDRVFVLNEQTVNTNYTIPNNMNATSCGPITIVDGVTVDIGDGENWSVV